MSKAKVETLLGQPGEGVCKALQREIRRRRNQSGMKISKEIEVPSVSQIKTDPTLFKTRSIQRKVKRVGFIGYF